MKQVGWTNNREYQGTVAIAAALALGVASLVGASACDGGRLDPSDWPDTPPGFVPADGGDTVANDLASDPGSDPGVADGVDAGPDTPGDTAPACTPTREYWETQVWDAFMATKCTACHISGGLAGGTSFVLDNAGTPSAVEASYQAVLTVAVVESGGKRILLAKPTNDLPHGGGPQITANSPEHLALIEFVTRVDTPVSCDP